MKKQTHTLQDAAHARTPLPGLIRYRLPATTVPALPAKGLQLHAPPTTTGYFTEAWAFLKQAPEGPAKLLADRDAVVQTRGRRQQFFVDTTKIMEGALQTTAAHPTRRRVADFLASLAPRMAWAWSAKGVWKAKPWCAALALAALLVPGGASAQVADSFNPSPNAEVFALALQPDQKVLVGGSFTNLAGQRRMCVGRLADDGSLDASFNPGVRGTGVYCLAVQADGRILVGGSFTNLAGQSITNLGRLKADGTLDPSFTGGANSDVFCLALQPDGKILAGGNFTRLGGQACTNLARLDTNGLPELGFNAGAKGGYVNCVALQPDGKIVVGGAFTNLAGVTQTNLGRLNSNGSADTGFRATANADVLTLAIQPDGKILVAGQFTNLNGQARSYLGRLNFDGSLNTNFTTAANNWVGCLALQTDGKILAAGWFGTLGGQGRSMVGRLNADGTLDATFTVGASGAAYFMAQQDDGRLLVAGSFTTLGGQARKNLARLTNVGAAPQSTAFDGATFTWLRGGACPEVWRTGLDSSTDGTNWTSQGAGTRVAGGWQWSGLAVPTNVTFRARGFVAASEYNGAAWFVETLSTVAPLNLTTQPQDRTNSPGTAATFSVSVTGMPFTCQWFKDGVALTNGGNLSGTFTPTLTLSNVLGADAGGYSVILSNSCGSVTSRVARLSVVDPFIIAQPADQGTNASETITFAVLASGTPPLTYTWRKDGAALTNGNNVSGAFTPTLTLSNVLGADMAGYSVVLSNGFGSLTSRVARLTVMDPWISAEPQNQVSAPGGSATFAVTAAGTAPLSYQWRKAGTNILGANLASLVLTNVQSPNEGLYDVVVSNAFGVRTSAVVVLVVNGLLPDAFNPGQDALVKSIALQRDGGILVAGWFSTLAGQPRAEIGRLNADGTLDNSFNPGATQKGDMRSFGVYSLGIQEDDKILVGGWFDWIAGQSRTGLARLNLNGTLDTNFTANVVQNPGYIGYGWSLACLAPQADGKILVWGDFSNLVGQACTSLGRLQPNGTLDSSFKPTLSDSPAFPMVLHTMIQPDGKILVGGWFDWIAGQARQGFGRLQADGTLDAGFVLGNTNSYGFPQALLADGRILASGTFFSAGGQTRTNLARLNPDGSLDLTFDPGFDGSGLDGSVAVQADGKILLGGSFPVDGGGPNYGIVRLNPDGTLDGRFAPVSGPGGVNTLALQADGRILVCGGFTNLVGLPRNGIGRLVNSIPATQSLDFDGSAITWLRGGSSPEVWRTAFAFSTNGSTWTSLGAGTRIAGGWQASGTSVPTNATVRARGFVSGGFGNGSSWFVETTVQGTTLKMPPAIVTQPGSRTNECGTSATFTVSATGPDPLGYYWYHGALPVGGNNASLTLNSVSSADAGSYMVVVTNATGSATSQVATLTVVDTAAPLITWNFTNLTLNAGAGCAALMPDVTGTNYLLAVDACAGSSLVVTQSIATNTVLGLGIHEVVLTVSDPSGNATYSTNWVAVRDTMPPMITVLGSNPLTNECHLAFVDPGSTAADNCTVANLTAHSTVNTNTPGTYTVTYVATDASGNATTNTRVVVVQDTLPPVPGAWPLPDVVAECAATVTAPTAQDACAGPVTVTTTNALTYTVQGDYFVHWTFSDSSGNVTNQTQWVRVHDTAAPIITLLGSNAVAVECHSAYTDAGATANDNCDGILTNRIVTVNPVDTNVPAVYTVTYSVSDLAGNPAAPVTRTVTVRDTTPPVITLLGSDPLTNECHTAFVDPGFMANDFCSSTLTLATNNTVEASSVGIYTNRYVASDASGNATPNTRVVFVIDSTPPVPDVWPLPDVVAQCAVTVTVPTAQDACAGPVTATTTNALTYTVQGDYLVHWTFSDSSGNTTNQTQVVHVHDTMAPTISNCPTNLLVTTGPARLTCDQVVTWAAPTASDNCGVTSLISDYNPGSVFPVGRTTVTYTARDAATNTTVCTFTVTVLDTTPPTIVCPPDLVEVPLDTNQCYASLANVALGLPLTADNCGIVAVTNDAPPRFLRGETLVTWTAVDSSSNTVRCVQTVTVGYHDPPVLAFALSGNNLTLSWPSSYACYQLVAQTNAIPLAENNNWSPVTGVSGNQITIPLDLTSPTVFYRLVSP